MTKNIKDWTDLSLNPTGINAHNLESGYTPHSYIPTEVGAGEGTGNTAAHQKGIDASLRDAPGDSLRATQAAHGFSVLEPIYHNGTQWAKARSNALPTLAEYVVVEVADVNNFKAVRYGRFIITSHGLPVGQRYLSDAVAGAVITTDTALYSEPVFFVEDANTINISVRRPPNRVVHPNLNILRGLYKGTVGDADNDLDLETVFKDALPSGSVVDLSPSSLSNMLVFRDGAFIFGGSGYNITSNSLSFTADGGGPLLENEEIEVRVFIFS